MLYLPEKIAVSRIHMARIEIGQYLVVDSRVLCRGRLIFKGMRVLVADVLALLEAGFILNRLLGGV